jgi:hypothetical protein
MPDLSVGLNCPACGGAISISEGDDVVNCKYCGSTLYIEGDNGVQTIAFKNRMNAESAKAAALQWWTHGWKARDLKKAGVVSECYPIYLPFWSISSRVTGWICGYEEHHHTDSNGHTKTERVYKEEMVLQDLNFSEIACDPGDLGLRTLRNFTGESSLEDFEMIPTFESTTSKDDAVSHAQADAMNRGRASANVPHVTFERLHVLPRHMSIIYYPVWVIRYTYRDRMYILTVDGVTGRPLSGRAPGDPLFQSLAVTGGTCLGGLLAAGGVLVMTAMQSEVGIALVFIGVAAPAAMYYFFRHGSEIIEGDFSDRRSPFNIKEFANIGKLIQGAYK